jgi:hypothetical protein
MMITKISDSIIWYDYKGDEIGWNGSSYLSLNCCGSFKTLKELDDFWDGYFKELGK